MSGQEGSVPPEGIEEEVRGMLAAIGFAALPSLSPDEEARLTARGLERLAVLKARRRKTLRLKASAFLVAIGLLIGGAVWLSAPATQHPSPVHARHHAPSR